MKSLLKFSIKVSRKKSSVESKKILVIEILDLLRQIKKVYEYDNII